MLSVTTLVVSFENFISPNCASSVGSTLATLHDTSERSDASVATSRLDFNCTSPIRPGPLPKVPTMTSSPCGCRPNSSATGACGHQFGAHEAEDEEDDAMSIAEKMEPLSPRP